MTAESFFLGGGRGVKRIYIYGLSSYPAQLSLAILPWIGAISTGYIRGIAV